MTRKHTADAVNHAMTRLPMIFGILDELGKAEIPFPGDDDISHGCQRAVTAMLVELARIEPAPPGRANKSEAIALGFLHSKDAARLIHTDQLERMQQFIERILGTPNQPPH